MNLRVMCKIFFICILFATTSCARYGSSAQESSPHPLPVLSSITFVDKNGLSETIAEKDRLSKLQNTDFLSPQPYQKVLQVFARDENGKMHSLLTSYHDNGQVRQYLEVINGRANGKYVEWYPTGNKRLEATVIEGKADLDPLSIKSWSFDGMSYVYREDGSLEAQVPYSKGIIEGESLRYSPNGAVIYRTQYKDGIKEALEETFYSSGKPKELLHYENGYRNGEAKGFYEDESLNWSELWDMGFLQEGVYYSKESTKTNTPVCTIENGTGQKAIFENGILTQTRQYQQGSEQGKVISYGPDGKELSFYHSKDGKKHGSEVRYYAEKNSASQQLKLSIDWHEGAMQGTVKTWYSSGVLESQREYMSNYKQGLSTAWYIDGSIMLMEEYEKDRLMRGEYRRRGENDPTTQVQHGKGIATLFDAHGALVKRIRYLDGLPQDD